MNTRDPYSSEAENQWCPGCPNFGIQTAVKRALRSLDLAPHQVCLVSGIGQAAKLPHYIRANVFNGLHGRALPAATGVHVANPQLKTIVTSGDGDLYGEGGNHFLHALRRNPDITVVVHNNQLYALTKGQASPTTPRGETTRLQVRGVEVDPAHMLATAVIHNCTFVARGSALDLDELADILTHAIGHRGLSLVEVVQPCITWGRHPISWYRDRLVPVPTDHDPTDRARALDLALESGDVVHVGVLFRQPERPTFAASYRTRLGDGPLAELPPIGRDVIAAQCATWGPPTTDTEASEEENG